MTVILSKERHTTLWAIRVSIHLFDSYRWNGCLPKLPAQWHRFIVTKSTWQLPTCMYPRRAKAVESTLRYRLSLRQPLKGPCTLRLKSCKTVPSPRKTPNPTPDHFNPIRERLYQWLRAASFFRTLSNWSNVFPSTFPNHMDTFPAAPLTPVPNKHSEILPTQKTFRPLVLVCPSLDMRCN